MERICTLKLEQLPTVMRFGVKHIQPDMLMQFALYSEGLFYLKVGKDKHRAVKCFIKALTTT
jgi:hypothetical protein